MKKITQSEIEELAQYIFREEIEDEINEYTKRIFNFDLELRKEIAARFDGNEDEDGASVHLAAWMLWIKKFLPTSLAVDEEEQEIDMRNIIDFVFDYLNATPKE